MIGKKQMSGMVAIVLLGGAFVSPVYAATTEQNTWRGGDTGGRMGARMMSGVRGSVTAITGTTLTIKDVRSGTIYTVDASGATVTKDNVTSSLTAVVVGDAVFVEGPITGTNVVASKIIDGQFRGPMGARGNRAEALDGVKPAAVGTVTLISGTTLTLTSHGFRGTPEAQATYTVDASGATVTKGGGASTVSAMTIGDNVVVEGTVNGTAITATKILDNVPQGRGNRGGMMDVDASALSGIQGSGAPIVMGKVSSVSESLISITNNGNLTYTIDATNAKVVKAGVGSATVANIAVGDVITVQGTTNGTSVVATSVIDQTPVSGNITTAAGGGAMVHRGFLGSLGHFFSSLFGF